MRTLSAGLADAFRSEQTPAFGTMLSQLFQRSPATQKTNVLNSLIASLGPLASIATPTACFQAKSNAYADEALTGMTMAIDGRALPYGTQRS